MESNARKMQYYKNIKEKQKKSKKLSGNFDYTLFCLVIFLVAFGVIMIYSSSSYHAQKEFANATYFLKKQLQWTLLGLVGMIAISYVDYHKLIKYTMLLYTASIIFLGLVLVIGEEINGAKRWISFGTFGGFQPSEFTKLALIIFMSYIVSKGVKRLDKYSGFIKYLLFIVPPILLIAVENLSTALVVAFIPIAILFVASPKTWHFLTLTLPIIIAAPIFLFVKKFAYRLNRIKAWKDPWQYPSDIGFQTIQSLYAIGSGGFFGKGLGQSMQKLGFIPEAHNDIIFSVICEELGLFVACMLILIFIMLVWRCMVIASHAPDIFGALLTVGVIAQIAFQVIINIAVVTNSIPSTGMPLPFISYGGSSLIFLLIEIGIVLNVSRQMKMKHF